MYDNYILMQCASLSSTVGKVESSIFLFCYHLKFLG